MNRKVPANPDLPDKPNSANRKTSQPRWSFLYLEGLYNAYEVQIDD